MTKEYICLIQQCLKSETYLRKSLSITAEDKKAAFDVALKMAKTIKSWDSTATYNVGHSIDIINIQKRIEG